MKLVKAPEIRVANSLGVSNSRKIFRTFFTISITFTEEPQLPVFLSAHLMLGGRSDIILVYYSAVIVKISVGSNGLSLLAYVITYNYQKQTLFTKGFRSEMCLIFTLLFTSR